MEQASFNQMYRFDQSPSAQAERLRKEARGTPAGVRRDQLLRRARQIEPASSVQERPKSPGAPVPHREPKKVFPGRERFALDLLNAADGPRRPAPRRRCPLPR